MAPPPGPSPAALPGMGRYNSLGRLRRPGRGPLPRQRHAGDSPQTSARMADVPGIRQATSADAELVQADMPLWREGELEPARIAADVGADLFFLAEYSGNIPPWPR